jgi:cytochrome c2
LKFAEEKSRSMKTKAILFALSFILVLSGSANPPAETGRLIFTSRCAGCHNVNKILTGPALAKVYERHTIDWIVNFVHSSQTVIKGGDKTAVALFEKFNKIQMPDHKDLSTDDIKSVVEYIKTEEKSGGTDVAPFARPGKLRPSYTPLLITNYTFFITYVAVVLMLVGALIALVNVKSLQRDRQNTF